MPALAAGAFIAGATTFLIGLGVFIRARQDLVRRLFFFFGLLFELRRELQSARKIVSGVPVDRLAAQNISIALFRELDEG